MGVQEKKLLQQIEGPTEVRELGFIEYGRECVSAAKIRITFHINCTEAVEFLCAANGIKITLRSEIGRYPADMILIIIHQQIVFQRPLEFCKNTGHVPHDAGR